MEQNNMVRGAQAVYFSHGGGPLPILGDASHQAMVEFMTRLPAQLTRPEAIVVVSAHWEEGAATLLGAPSPPMFYDYYGFPREAYDITYPAPGHPALAERIAGLLEKNDIPARIDTRRGFDHGLFIPLKLMYPRADIPSIQLSLLRGLDPAAHIALGKALRDIAGRKHSGHRLGLLVSQPERVFRTGPWRARSGERRLPGLAYRDVHRAAVAGGARTALDRMGASALRPLLPPPRGAPAAPSCVPWAGGRARQSGL